MNSSLLATFGILSAVLSIIGFIPYIRDILQRKTKPERATWWIWLMLNAIAFAAQVDAGATWALFLTGSAVVTEGLIAFLSLSYGYGRFKRKDLVSLLIAMFGLILWKFTSDPLYALLIVIAVDVIAVWLTATKTWEAPNTETLSAWTLASLGGLFGVLAVGKTDFTQIIYPIYILAANLGITWVIIYRRKLLA